MLDRLPLSVTLTTIRDVAQRVEIIRRNLDARTDPAALRGRFEAEEAALRDAIAEARKRLPQTALAERDLYQVAGLCAELGVDGHRPEIVIARTAAAGAAFHGRTEVSEDDLRDAARLALGHRTRDGGFDAPATEAEIDDAFDRVVRRTRKWPDEGKWPRGREIGDLARAHALGGGGKKR